MESHSKEDWLKILNNYLGYGNPNATIYFIGLEEKSPWTIENLIKDSDPDTNLIRDWLEKNAQLDIATKIERMKEQFGFDFEMRVKECLDEYEKNGPIFSDNRQMDAYKGNRTDCKQSDLSLEILKLLKLVPEDEDNVTYYKSRFASSDGFEACLNYYPVARAKTNISYEEEGFLFGTSAINKFGDKKIEVCRMKRFKDIFAQIIKRSNNYVFLILLGKPALSKLKDLIDCRLEELGNGIAANDSRNIWSIYHPSYYGFWENRRLLIKEIENNYLKER